MRFAREKCERFGRDDVKESDKFQRQTMSHGRGRYRDNFHATRGKLPK